MIPHPQVHNNALHASCLNERLQLFTTHPLSKRERIIANSHLDSTPTHPSNLEYAPKHGRGRAGYIDNSSTCANENDHAPPTGWWSY